jgi:hypothetical protein
MVRGGADGGIERDEVRNLQANQIQSLFQQQPGGGGMVSILKTLSFY